MLWSSRPDTVTPAPDTVTSTSSSRSAAGLTSTVTVTDEPSSTLYDAAPKDTVSCAAAVVACLGVSGTQALLPAWFTERTCAWYEVFDFRPDMAALSRFPSSTVVTSRMPTQLDAGDVLSLYRTS